jgi:hypothetical protein
MEKRIVIISIVFVILYGLGLYLWNKKVRWRLSKKSFQWIKYTHYILVALAITAGLLNYIDDISLRGLWTTNLIVMGLLLSGTLIYPLSDWTYKTQFEKYYFQLFSYLPILIAFFLMIPFIGLVIGASLLGRLIEPAHKIYYEDNKLRVQSTFVGVMGVPRLDVFEKRGLFEFQINKLIKNAGDLDSVKIEQGTSNTFVLLYYGHEIRDTVKIGKIE